jgi:hypothetical protein
MRNPRKLGNSSPAKLEMQDLGRLKTSSSADLESGAERQLDAQALRPLNDVRFEETR